VLDLNGLPFSLKLGLLIQKMNVNEMVSGSQLDNRVVKRNRFA